jgi:glycosidase
LPSGRTPAQQEIFAHIQALLRMRRDHPALRVGSLCNIQWDQSSYVFARMSSPEKILVAFNSGESARSLHIKFAGTPLSGIQSVTPLLNGEKEAVANNAVDLSIPAHELQVYLAR